MTPDPSFVKDLQAYDPRLRVRFGKHTERWIIERKVEIRNPAWLAERPLNPFGTGPRAKDLWQGWRAGYVCVMLVDPQVLNWQMVAPELARSDMQQAGSWEALSDRIDAADAQMEAERERTVANWSEAASKDAADHLFWQQGHTVAMPREPSAVVSSDGVEQREGYVVRVKKGAHGAA